jgi:apolipoprotein N-acyltransferase
MTKLIQRIFIVVILPVCTGFLLGISAIPSHFYYLTFIAFLPLLFASDYIKSYSKPLLIFALQLLIALVVFYLMGFYWVLQSANIGFLLAFILVLPYVLIVPIYILLKNNGNKFSSLYFIAAWLTVELIQANFQLGSPFYNLGNNLGANPKLIQWFEFTGSSGGTLWILTINFLFFSLIKTFKIGKKRGFQRSAILLAVVCAPIIVSVIIYTNYKEKGDSKEVLVIHPSTDNKDVKYRLNIYELMDIYLDVMLPQLTENTEYVVLPETAITNAGWVKDFNRNLVFNHFYEHTDSFPNLKLITGAIVYEEILNVKKIKDYQKIPGVKYSEKYQTWYYIYNAALQIEKKQAPQIRAKEELVPYQEYAPYPLIMPRLSPVGIDFQFSKKSNSPSVFRAANNLTTSAIVCYEVVYSKLFYKASIEGAQAFFVLLNEGWYETEKVSQQFLQHSAIRAVENRRSIAHSSNMGITALINQRGDVIAKTESKQADFLQGEIKMNRKVTLAAKLGNYIEVLALLTAVCLFVYVLIFQVKKHDRNTL